MHVWDAETGQLVARTKGHDDKVIHHRWDSPYVRNEVYRHTPLGSYRGGTINALAFSADGCQVASGSDDETVRVWDAKSGEELAQFAIPITEDRTIDDHGEVRSVAFTPDGNVGAIAADRWFRAWDWRSGTVQSHYPLLERTWQPTFSPDGSRFCLVAGREILDFDSPPGEQAESFEIEFRPKRIFFTNNGSHVVVVWDKGGGIVWNRATKQVVHTFETQQGEVIGGWINDGNILFASQLSGATSVRVDLATGSHLPFEALSDSLRALTLSPDGRWFATVADKGLRPTITASRSY